MRKYKISLIIPFYNEEEMIDLCFQTVLPILDNLKQSYEVVCVDDGSVDKTYSKLLEWKEKNLSIKILKLSRNFGKEAALTAGLDNTSGDCVIPMDADLQDPPSEIPRMIEKWQEGYDVVLMQRTSRQEPFFKKFFANAFYKYVARACKIPIKRNVGDFRLLDKRVVDVIKLLREKNRFCKGLLSWPGFNTATLYFKRPARAMGEEKMSFVKCLALALDAIFSFSIIPIRVFTVLGIICSAVSFSFGLWIIYQKLFIGISISGYASLMVAVMFLNGTIMLGIGILGEYIGRIYSEVKNRPIYVVDSKKG